MNKYIYKDYFFMNSYQQNLTIKIDKDNIYHEYEHLLDKRFIIDDTSNFHYYCLFDEAIKEDGYIIDVTKKHIKIKVSSPRGIRYAIDTLNSLICHQGLPIIYIADEPSFKKRGIIEGYYGVPWTYEERLDMVDFMDKHRLNVYMYAPKSDIYHREKWYELYPPKELNLLLDLKNKLSTKDIDFVYCISPGYKTDDNDGFKYNEEDFKRLFNKLDQVLTKGVRHFGLLLDDIDYTLTGENLKTFKRPGIAHAYICNKMYDYLISKNQNIEMVMCPTEYHQVGRTPYRDDLKDNLNKQIAVFWTGDNVCAEVITEEQVKITKEAFGSDLYIWDNFPVTDFTYGVRQFIAPIQNRTVKLCEYASSYIINPMNDYYASQIGMATMADYAWNSQKYDADKSFKNALTAFGKDFYADSIDYFNYNFPSVLNYGSLEMEKKMVDNYQYHEIKEYYQNVVISVEKMLMYEIPLIDELKPWLEHLLSENEIVNKIIDKRIKKEELIKFYESINFSGSELLDYLVKDEKLLTEEEYDNCITKRRGRKWYRIWEKRN